VSETSNQKKFCVTRWKQLIFPKELIIDESSVLTRKRKFPAFWIIQEESIPLRSVASVQIYRGLFFSSLLIENSGGPYPIQIEGIPNRLASEIRRLIEGFNPSDAAEIPQTDKPDKFEESLPKVEPKKSRRPIFNPFKNIKLKREKKYMQFDDLEDDLWGDLSAGSEFDPVIDNELSEDPIPEADVLYRMQEEEQSETSHLPSIDEALDEYEKRKSASPGWMEDIVTPPAHSSKK